MFPSQLKGFNSDNNHLFWRDGLVLQAGSPAHYSQQIVTGYDEKIDVGFWTSALEGISALDLYLWLCQTTYVPISANHGRVTYAPSSSQAGDSYCRSIHWRQ